MNKGFSELLQVSFKHLFKFKIHLYLAQDYLYYEIRKDFEPK